ncbi:MAG: S8 family serine peptidase [Mangrovicoccus sp.]
MMHEFKPSRGKFFWAACVCTALLSACSPGQIFAPAPTVPVAVLDQDQIFALIGQGVSQADLQKAAQAGGYELLKRESLAGLGLELLTYRMPQGVTGAQAIAYLEAAEPGATVGVNHAFHPVDQPGNAGPHYAAAVLNWPQAGCRAQAPVGIIDTGVDPKASALAAARVVNKDFTQGRAPDPRHGTEIAAVLANPQLLTNVTLYSAAVVRQGPEGQGAAGADAILRAIDWLEASGVRLVNISLAGPYNKLLSRAVAAAEEKGLRIVAAVGNAGPRAKPLYPAAFPNVIGVTAIDARGRVYSQANRGDYVDVAAPGVDVFVELGAGSRFVSGTSIAAPYVTARILADPSLAQSEDIEALRSGLQAGVEDLGAPGIDPVYGAGLPRFKAGCTD